MPCRCLGTRTLPTCLRRWRRAARQQRAASTPPPCRPAPRTAAASSQRSSSRSRDGRVRQPSPCRQRAARAASRGLPAASARAQRAARCRQSARPCGTPCRAETRWVGGAGAMGWWCRVGLCWGRGAGGRAVQAGIMHACPPPPHSPGAFLLLYTRPRTPSPLQACYLRAILTSHAKSGDLEGALAVIKQAKEEALQASHACCLWRSVHCARPCCTQPHGVARQWWLCMARRGAQAARLLCCSRQPTHRLQLGPAGAAARGRPLCRGRPQAPGPHHPGRHAVSARGGLRFPACFSHDLRTTRCLDCCRALFLWPPGSQLALPSPAGP